MLAAAPGGCGGARQECNQVNLCKLLGTVICAVFLLPTASAVTLGQNAPAADRWLAASCDDSPASAGTTLNEPQCADGLSADLGRLCHSARWTASAEFIILDRIGSLSQPLVETAPGNVPLDQLYGYPCTLALSDDDFHQGFYGGPRLGLIRQGDSGCNLELSYFQIDGWTSARTVGPYDRKAESLVMKAPVEFVQTQDSDQSMVWQYSTQLYNAELGGRWNLSDRVTVLAGVRWLELRENLQGALEPPTFDWEPPFWNVTTTNNLYGFQIGADGTVWQRGRFSITGLLKAGIFDNNAQQSTDVSIYKFPWPCAASTNHAAFVGETGLTCKYQLTKRLVLKAGYEALWLDGVALASGQIRDTSSSIKPVKVEALGVNCGSGVFFHGATAGLECSF